MRDFKLSSKSFCESVKKHARMMVSLDDENLRNRVVDNSNLHWDNLTFFNLRAITLKNYIRLAILSWYIPEEVGYVLRADLVQKSKQLSPEDRLIIKLLTESQGQMLIFLQETTLWHTRDFFGNILSKKVNLNKYLSVSPLRKKVLRPERKRGYHDHGSRVPSHKWVPRSDWSLTALQNEIEEKRKSHQDTYYFLEGMLI